jgi:predicted nuclease of restriction endonuclease-like (RecB) superfamily
MAITGADQWVKLSDCPDIPHQAVVSVRILSIRKRISRLRRPMGDMRHKRDPSGKGEITRSGLESAPDELITDIRYLVTEARSAVAATINAGLTLLYWRVGRRIRREVLGNERAEYGEKIVHALSAQLKSEFGEGFGRRNLFNMIRFAEVFPDEQIVRSFAPYLSWTHMRQIIYIDDPLKRDFYAEMCRVERWSTRTLQKKIDSMLFERTALSRKPDVLAQQELSALREEDRMTPDLVFRDPYILDFLQLKDTYSENDLEAAILQEIEQFLLELGAGFTFVARQKRMVIGNEDFYLDLLFFHRKLRRLIAVELKIGHFKAEYKGQMELYLRWLEKYERENGEERPLGLILCAGANQEQVSLLELDRSGIHVAEYLTELPPRELLEQKLKAAVHLSREQFSVRKDKR